MPPAKGAQGHREQCLQGQPIQNVPRHPWKDFVAGLKQQAKAVDEQRSMLRNRLDALRDEVRRPLTEIEEAEKAHEDSIKEAIAEMANKAAMPGSIEDLRVRLEELESVKIDISFRGG